jgi:hypothetical protein
MMVKEQCPKSYNYEKFKMKKIEKNPSSVLFSTMT